MKCLHIYEMMQSDTTRRIRRKESSYLCCIDRICQRLALVERLKESIEALGHINDSLLRFDIEVGCIHHLGQLSLEALSRLYLYHPRLSLLSLFEALQF